MSDHDAGGMPLDADAAVGDDAVKRYRGYFLIEPPTLDLRLWLHPEHALPKRVDLLNKQGRKVVSSVLREPWRVEQAGLPPLNVEREVGSNHAILQMLRGGEHLTVLSSLALDQAADSGYLVLIPVRGLNLRRNFWAVRAPQARELPAADTFIDFLRSHPPH